MKLIIFDIETTGLDRTKDSIIQFAGLKIEYLIKKKMLKNSQSNDLN